MQCATKRLREDSGSQTDDGIFGALLPGRWFLADDIRPTDRRVAVVNTDLLVGGDSGVSSVLKAMTGVCLNGPNWLRAGSQRKDKEYREHG